MPCNYKVCSVHSVWAKSRGNNCDLRRNGERGFSGATWYFKGTLLFFNGGLRRSTLVGMYDGHCLFDQSGEISKNHDDHDHTLVSLRLDDDVVARQHLRLHLVLLSSPEKDGDDERDDDDQKNDVDDDDVLLEFDCVSDCMK